MSWSVCKILVLIFERKTPFCRPRCKWADNVNIYINNYVDWINMAQQRAVVALVNTNVQDQYQAKTFLIDWATGGFSKKDFSPWT